MIVPHKNFKHPKRSWWLIAQIKENGYRKGAEIGCLDGRTSSKLLEYCPKLTLLCVDLWEYKPEVHTKYQMGNYARHAWVFPDIKKQFNLAVQPYQDRVVKLQGVSWEMADKVEDNSLDFIFIDADHGYESVKKDIMAWTPKLKPGGLLSGHDINIPGVLQAVEELLVNWIDTEINQVWYCKKEDYDGI